MFKSFALTVKCKPESEYIHNKLWAGSLSSGVWFPGRLIQKQRRQTQSDQRSHRRHPALRLIFTQSTKNKKRIWKFCTAGLVPVIYHRESLINYLQLHAQCMARSLNGKHLQCIMTAVLPQSRGGSSVMDYTALTHFKKACWKEDSSHCAHGFHWTYKSLPWKKKNCCLTHRELRCIMTDKRFSDSMLLEMERNVPLRLY